MYFISSGHSLRYVGLMQSLLLLGDLYFKSWVARLVVQVCTPKTHGHDDILCAHL